MRHGTSTVSHNFVGSCRACEARQLTGAWYAPYDFTANKLARHGTRRMISSWRVINVSSFTCAALSPACNVLSFACTC